MEDFASILVRDYGLKPQGKSAPMSSAKGSPSVGSSRVSGYGSDRRSVSGRMSGNASTFGGQDDVPYVSRKNGSTKSSGRSTYGGGAEELFHPGNYDDVFGGPPKMSSSGGPRYDDVFGETPEVVRAPVYDDLFGGLGVNEAKGKYSSSSGLSPRATSPRRPGAFASEPAGFDELLPGFSSVSSEPAAKSRPSENVKVSHDEDPFVPPLIDDPLSTAPNNSSSSASFIDPMDVFTVPPTMPPINTSSTDGPRASSNASGAYDGFDIFDGFTGQSSVDASKPRESSQSSRDDLKKSVEDLKSNHSTGVREQSPIEETEPLERDLPTVDTSEAYNISAKSSPFFSFKSDDGMETPAASGSSFKPVDDGQAGIFASPLDSPVPYKSRSRSSPFREVKEKWLTVNDVKLVTKPSSVPPPSRPPPMPGSGRFGSGSRPRIDHMESAGQDDRFVSSSWPSANSTASVAYATSSEEEQTGGGTPGGSRKDFFGRADYKTNLANHAGDEEKDGEDDSAGARAREKERHEKEEIKIAREKEIREAEAREEREKERARKYREKEREREKDRAAVQKVTLEARERAAQEARERAERTAVERATQEARERAAQQAQIRAERERAAVERANAEARERAEQRAALEKAAKERAEQRAAVERAAAEARERAERIAVERAQQEARERAEKAAAERQRAERAAAEAREREAAERVRERSNQQQRKSEHDLDAFFNPGLRSTPPSSEPKQRTPSANNNSDPNGVRRSVNNTRPSSAPADDFMRLFDDPPPTSNSGEDPNRKRSGAQQRSQQRAAKAIEEIKQRDLEMQREQAEKHRAADQLDAEIRRWAAGKEGNLRALLSTLQYVLWPECGWQPVSLSDLITAASVKKTYRKATLHVHPDKVQQKGATVQQKYIAEKVFDLLKEASNKFNSEELF